MEPRPGETVSPSPITTNSFSIEATRIGAPSSAAGPNIAMNDTTQPNNIPTPSRQSFAALRHAGARAYLVGTMLVMLADSIEHVISYWVIFQKFDSPALAGFAVISHWAPFILFSVWAGALADRFDPRRLIQAGMLLFMIASVGWGFFFLTDSLEMWHAMVLLVIHGLAGVIWGPAGQMLIHDIVGPAQLQSGVRLLATARTLGLLLGPVVGTGLMFAIGPAWGITVNALIYLPLVWWLWKAPYGPKFRDEPARPFAAIRGLADILQTIGDIAGNPVIVFMTLLAGGAALFVGNAHQAQMPEFATDLGAASASFYYGMLLTANGLGALIAGLVLESRSLLPARPKSVFVLVILWCLAMAGFAASTDFLLSVGLLLIAGFLHLSYSSMAQTLVQLHAPPAIRGRVLGLYSMSSLGMITFSGFTVGIIGDFIGIHWSLALSAGALLVATSVLSAFSARPLRAQLAAASGGE